MPALEVGGPAPEQIHSAKWLNSYLSTRECADQSAGPSAFSSTQTYDEDAVSSLENSLRNGRVFRSANGFRSVDFQPRASCCSSLISWKDYSSCRRQPDEIAAFFHILLSATRHASARIHVAVALRSESLGECAEWPALAEAINDGQFLNSSGSLPRSCDRRSNDLWPYGAEASSRSWSDVSSRTWPRRPTVCRSCSTR